MKNLKSFCKKCSVVLFLLFLNSACSSSPSNTSDSNQTLEKPKFGYDLSSIFVLNRAFAVGTNNTSTLQAKDIEVPDTEVEECNSEEDSTVDCNGEPSVISLQEALDRVLTGKITAKEKSDKEKGEYTLVGTWEILNTNVEKRFYFTEGVSGTISFFQDMTFALEGNLGGLGIRHYSDYTPEVPKDTGCYVNGGTGTYSIIDIRDIRLDYNIFEVLPPYELEPDDRGVSLQYISENKIKISGSSGCFGAVMRTILTRLN